MTSALKRLFAPPYSGLVGFLATVVGIATEFTNPASAPALVGVFGEQWTKGLVSVCVLIVLVSRVPQVKAVLDQGKGAP